MTLVVLRARVVSIISMRLNIDHTWLMLGPVGLVYGMTQNRRPHTDGNPLPSMSLFASRHRGRSEQRN
jgi:hypothetical protein